MAAVASDVLERMMERGLIKRDSVRVIYQSELFPTSSFAYTHNLAPSLVRKMKYCFFNFNFTPLMKTEFQGDEHYIPIEYAPAWSVVRKVNEQAEATFP